MVILLGAQFKELMIFKSALARLDFLLFPLLEAFTMETS